jgi:hypothetical protein
MTNRKEMNGGSVVTTRRLYWIESVAVLTLALLSCVNMFARQQDSTVEWKVTLQDLAHRLAGLGSDDAAELESWRVDAEGLRTAVLSFAAEHPSMEIAVPGALPEKAGAETLARQLDGLTSAVDQIMRSGIHDTGPGAYVVCGNLRSFPSIWRSLCHGGHRSHRAGL